MKCAIVSLAETPRLIEVSRLTYPAFQRYAGKMGFERMLVRPDPFPSAPHWQLKFALIREALILYDRVLYLEPWMVMRFDCPDVFKLVPEDSIGMFEETDMFPDRVREAGVSRLFNSDVIIASRKHFDYFKIDGSVMDTSKEKIFPLPHRFNRLPETVAMTGERFLDSYIANMAFEADREDRDEGLRNIQAIIGQFEVWEYQGIPPMPKRINIDAPGSLGDCVAMEPIVRYIATVMHPEAVVRVRTEFRPVFEHLFDLKPKGFFQILPDEEEFRLGYQIDLMARLPGISFNMMHPLDYGSLMAFGGHLPDEHKGIQLRADEEAMGEVLGHILIHPGKTWQTRTMPAEFWQEIIDGLIEAGYPVAIIGKTYDDDFRGTVNGIDASRCLDLRNKLSLKELFTAIRDAVFLISNDSSPIHISGAFVTPTLMVNCAKNKDFIWPHRNPDLNVTLGRPIAASTPKVGLVNSTRLDTCDPRELAQCLPKPREVVRAVTDYLGG